MTPQNSLAPLFNAAAMRYAQHTSEIAKLAHAELLEATSKPIVKLHNTVEQCSELEQAYKQAQNPILTLIEQLESSLHWTDSGAGKKPGAVQAKMAFIELLGPTGMLITNTCRVGLFFQQSNTLYPKHRHAAEELYTVISGEANWSRENPDSTVMLSPGAFIHHDSWEIHAMETTEQPLLAMWCWTGNIAFDQYEVY